MVSQSTPLQRLDEAIHEYLRDADLLSEGGFVSGWALGVSTSRIQADDESLLPLVTGATYTLRPQTSIIEYAGLAKYLSIVAEKAAWEQLSDSDD